MPELLEGHHFQHALLTHDPQASEQYEPNASDFTSRSLLMNGPTHIFDLYVESPSVDLWMSSVSALHSVLGVSCLGSCSFHLNSLEPNGSTITLKIMVGHKCTCTN